jgi:DNA ligase-1
LSERRKLLTEHFLPIDGEFSFAKASDGQSVDEIQAFLEESVKDGCEGLMVKMLDGDASFYEPSRRSVNWLKVSTSFAVGGMKVFSCRILLSSRRTIWPVWETPWIWS